MTLTSKEEQEFMDQLGALGEATRVLEAAKVAGEREAWVAAYRDHEHVLEELLNWCAAHRTKKEG